MRGVRSDEVESLQPAGTWWATDPRLARRTRGAASLCVPRQLTQLLFEFSTDYPFKGPVVHFENKVYHPNVDEHGGTWWAYMQRCAWAC